MTEIRVAKASAIVSVPPACRAAWSIFESAQGPREAALRLRASGRVQPRQEASLERMSRNVAACQGKAPSHIRSVVAASEFWFGCIPSAASPRISNPSLCYALSRNQSPRRSPGALQRSWNIHECSWPVEASCSGALDETEDPFFQFSKKLLDRDQRHL